MDDAPHESRRSCELLRRSDAGLELAVVIHARHAAVLDALRPILKGERVLAVLLGVLILPRSNAVAHDAERIVCELAIVQRKFT